VGRVLPLPPTAAESPEAQAARRERVAFYSSRRWRRVAAYFLARNPVCQICNHAAASVVDHVLPRLDRPDLAFSAANLRTACRPCHNRLGAKHTGG
jgi:5-methylcytosine-specific restriction endonuclease McrA